MLPKVPEFHKVNAEENLQQLFDFDVKVAKASPHALPLETLNDFLNFYTIDHNSEMYIYNDQEGNLVGFFAVIYFLSENTMELLSIMIDPDSQRQGYGKKIMSFTENLAKETGLSKIKLVTNIKNIPAIEFYKSIGYEIIKEIKDHYGDSETRLMLEKKV
jgi:ribosomal protein S18 acetylase RimI-like enzyme